MLAVGCSRQAYIRVKTIAASTEGEQIARGGANDVRVGVVSEWIGAKSPQVVALR
jgi:hypothetical protein